MFARRSPAKLLQTGLCDMSIAAVDITAPSVPAQARPPKRSFAEMDDAEDEGTEPNSDELYGWVEDDEVAAEGLLIDETPAAAQVAAAESRATPAARPTDDATESPKVTRPATL